MDKIMHLPLGDELDQSIEKFIQELRLIDDGRTNGDTVFEYLQAYFYPNGAGAEFERLTLDDINYVDTEKTFLLRQKLETIQGSPLYRLIEEIIHYRLKAYAETKHRSALYAVLNQCMKKPKPTAKKKPPAQRRKGLREFWDLPQ